MGRRSVAPLVAICGRPNVGKSTLFNRLVGRSSAIVHSEAGVTRDRAYANARWGDRTVRVVDTGGIVEHPTDPVTKKIQSQVRIALEEAGVILFVVDGQQELTRTDYEVRDELYRVNKPTLLAVNKLDNARLREHVNDFYVLGLGDPIAVSATHGTGIDDLIASIVASLPPPGTARHDSAEAQPLQIAIIGKPNVGKSSFLNNVLNEDRSIVDDQPGTTRDAIDVEFHWKGVRYLLIDTAGLRKKAGIHREVERFSVARSLRAVRRADVCLILIDASEGITEQDKRVINYVTEQGRPMVVVWTKWDLIERKEERIRQLAGEIELKAPFLKFVPYLTISNTTRQRIFRVFDYINRVAGEAEKRIPTARLNAFLEQLRGGPAPSSRRGRAARIKYATQAGVKPTVFVLFVNDKSLFHFSYLRHIENQIREKFGFEGVPIRFELREGVVERR
jgi:GTP-binding protein